jgi:predicted amidophosphoribosyltransferase
VRLRRVPYVLAELAAPPACGVCAGVTTPTEFLCAGCDRELLRGTPPPLTVPGIDVTWAARPYESTARDLIAALKFRQLLPAATRAADLIASEAPPDVLSGAVVPVPPDPLRHLMRGFDSAKQIADELARRTGLPICTCLRRTRGARQVGRTRSQRLSSPPRVRLREPPPTHAVLVDDVSTTGATLSACAAALRRAGCKEVRAVVLAAAPA